MMAASPLQPGGATFVLSVLIAMAAHSLCDKQPNSQRICTFYSIAGTCLLSMPAPLLMLNIDQSMTWLTIPIPLLWLSKIFERNTQRFSVMPADMKSDGYIPGRY